jgi:hypothetical protein
MKIVFNETTRFGTNRFEEGQEVEIPDRIAEGLIAAGKATAANGKKPKKAAEAKEAKEEAKSYKTRQLHAEKKK